MTLSQQKQLLIAESNLLRAEISLQLDAIQETVGWVDHGLRAGRAIQKGAPLLGILGSLFLAWKMRKKAPAAEEAAAAEPSFLSRWVTRGLQVANFVGPVVAMFRTRPAA